MSVTQWPIVKITVVTPHPPRPAIALPRPNLFGCLELGFCNCVLSAMEHPIQDLQRHPNRVSSALEYVMYSRFQESKDLEDYFLFEFYILQPWHVPTSRRNHENGKELEYPPQGCIRGDSGGEIWHTGAVDLNSISANHDGPAASTDPSSLSRCSGVAGLKRPSNIKSVDYYPTVRNLTWEYRAERGGRSYNQINEPRKLQGVLQVTLYQT
ncbi:hypothetical protein B0H13DRAFT_1860260 [Mycena leptocephala]|nr:hypothetical protein B0H13DRAFT_1860260 [Mycena leptocephala]